jgi:hypothetical protein
MGAINGTGDDDPSIEPKSQLLFFCFILPLSLFVLLSYGSWIYNYKKNVLMQSVPKQKLTCSFTKALFLKKVDMHISLFYGWSFHRRPPPSIGKNY